MKTNNIHTLLVLLAVWVLYPQPGQAFYSPSRGRWLSRDPSAELTVQPAAQPPLSFAYSDIELADEHEAKGDAVPDPLATVRPAYRFVDNDPIAHVDALGEDIYIQRGNGSSISPNGWLHLAVCVDTWRCTEDGLRKTGKACFSFGGTGRLRLTFPSWNWLGWSVYNTGGFVEGRIYAQGYCSGKVIAQQTTTGRQDLTWYLYMMGRVNTTPPDTYSLDRYNCRRYSKYEFRDAPLHMGPP